MDKVITFMNNDISRQLSIALITAIITTYVGIKIFYKQKEYEAVRHRYLEECVDLLCSNIDYMLGIFRNNWVKSLQLLQQFRDAGLAMKKEDYVSPFIPLDYELFTITPFYRLKTLLDDNIFWEMTQLLYAFIEKSYALFERDMLKAISYYIESNESDTNTKDISNVYFPVLQSIEKESHKFYNILTYLLKISSLFEKEKFSFKQLGSFKERQDVKKIINGMYDHFSEDIKKRIGE